MCLRHQDKQDLAGFCVNIDECFISQKIYFLVNRFTLMETDYLIKEID